MPPQGAGRKRLSGKGSERVQEGQRWVPGLSGPVKIAGPRQIIRLGWTLENVLPDCLATFERNKLLPETTGEETEIREIMEARVGIEPAYTELQDELFESIFFIKYRCLKNLPHKQLALIRALQTPFQSISYIFIFWVIFSSPPLSAR